MSFRQLLFSTAAAIGITAMALAVPDSVGAQQTVIQIDKDDIGGVVSGPNGPEAGVWVIAETTELPTKHAKIVVTDDQGRYVIPDLPNANYQVWIRGYGLVDSPKVRAKPGQQLNLTAVPAPNERSAAQYYPAIYWYALMRVPPTASAAISSARNRRAPSPPSLANSKQVRRLGCAALRRGKPASG